MTKDEEYSAIRCFGCVRGSHRIQRCGALKLVQCGGRSGGARKGAKYKQDRAETFRYYRLVRREKCQFETVNVTDIAGEVPSDLVVCVSERSVRALDVIDWGWTFNWSLLQQYTYGG